MSEKKSALRPTQKKLQPSAKVDASIAAKPATTAPARSQTAPSTKSSTVKPGATARKPSGTRKRSATRKTGKTTLAGERAAAKKTVATKTAVTTRKRSTATAQAVNADTESNGSAALKPRRRRSPRTERVAVVAGLRTAFARQGTAFRRVNSIDLGRMIVTELLARCELDSKLVQQLVFGNVLSLPEAPNIAREIVLGTGMSPAVDAFSVSRACATSYQSVACVADAIQLGRIEIGIAGGADSSSVVPIQVSSRMSRILVDLAKMKTLGQKLSLLSKLRPADFIPVAPAVKDYTTGLSMGQCAEQMARDHGISREAQDDLAHRSHQLAAEAWVSGVLRDEVMTAYTEDAKAGFSRDNNIRFDSRRENYAKLKPAFDHQFGSVTAANSTPLTDGAAALVLMRESRARALGYKPLGYIRAYAFAAIEATRDMLMGPSYATPKVLDQMKMKLSDLSLIDMHEAFAAQTLCNVAAFGSKQFAQEKLGRTQAIGEIDMDRFNSLGGSLAYGHPFAATGARQITQLLRALARRGGGFGLATACAAGGLAAAMILEAEA